MEELTTQSASMWDLLPDCIIETIFGCIYTGDRVRLRLVCKSWNRILLQDHLPKSPEAPWKILSNDSYNNPEPYLTEVCFRSLSEDRIYRFKLPNLLLRGAIDNDVRGWLCGSSRGWLVLAVGQDLNPDMFLWNPLSGATRQLPPLSTLPFFDDCLRYPFPGVVVRNFSCAVSRVEVFSTASSECVVAALFAASGDNRMAMCTPLEKRWTTFDVSEGPEHKIIKFRDILFSSRHGSLYAISDHKFSSETERENLVSDLAKFQVRLADCRVQVTPVFAESSVGVMGDQLPRGLSVDRYENMYWYLMESSVTGEVVRIGGTLNILWNNIGAGQGEFIREFYCQQTKSFCIIGENNHLVGRMKDESIFLGVTGAVSHSVANGIELGCMYFALDKAVCGVEDNSILFVVREHGVYNVYPEEKKTMHRTSCGKVTFLPGSKVGWFRPRLHMF